MFEQFRAPDERRSPATKASQIGLIASLQGLARANRTPMIADCGFRVFSQFEEDGYLLFLAAVLEPALPKIFVDIGAADGINSNCANLAINLGWHGLFIDGNEVAIRRGRSFYEKAPDTRFYPPVFRQAMVTRENINSIIREAGLTGDIGIVSIDIDGNDYWVWDALEAVRPGVVIIETHVEYGLRNIVVPYDPDFVHPGRHEDYFGASPAAMNLLAARKGYRLVGANRFGFNLIFVRNGIGDSLVPEVPLESVLRHPRHLERLSRFENVKELPFVSPDQHPGRS